MTGMPQNDRRLLDACFSGDRAATETLVRRFSGVVYHAVRAVLAMKDIWFADENIRELHNSVFLHLFDRNCKKLKQYTGKNGCSLATWIRVVTVRVVLNETRKKGFDSIKSRWMRLSSDELPELCGKGDDALSRMHLADRVGLLRKGLETLPETDRHLLTLLYLEEKDVPEVAGELSISIQAVYTRKHRAMQRLQAYYKESLEEI